MLNRMMNLFTSPESVGPQEAVRVFTMSDRPIDSALMTSTDDGWRITTTAPRRPRVPPMHYMDKPNPSLPEGSRLDAKRGSRLKAN